MGSCWSCKFLIDFGRTNLFKTSSVTGSESIKSQPPKNLWPDKNPDEGCKHFQPSFRKQSAGSENIFV
jgi:hypothetical protein